MHCRESRLSVCLLPAARSQESFKANLYAVKDAHNSLAPDDEQRDVLFGLTDAVLKLNQFVCNTSTVRALRLSGLVRLALVV